MKPKKPYEKVEKDLKTKTIYYYVDERNNIRVKSREVFKNKNVVVHYPFSTRNGQRKYDSVEKFIFVDMPEKLQRGFTSWQRGYGFTKTLSRITKPLFDGKKDCQVVIGPKQTNSVNEKKITTNSKSLDREFPKFSSLFESHSKELNIQAQTSLSILFPRDFKPPKTNYKADALNRFIRRSGITADDLSQKDVSAILELTKDTEQDDLLTNESSVLQARERIEKFYIETVIEEYEKLLKQKTATDGLEEKWQQFFRKYNWIFSQLFSSAVLFFQDKAYVGGKTIENKEGKVADFIYKNSFTDNVAIIEIKTHKTPLIRKQSYRGKDVYALDKELSGAFNQVLDQRDNLQKEFYDLNKKSSKDFETYNSECLIIVGSLKGLSANHKKAFELHRSNSKDVKIVTFDEVLVKLKGLKKIITGKSK